MTDEGTPDWLAVKVGGPTGGEQAVNKEIAEFKWGSTSAVTTPIGEDNNNPQQQKQHAHNKRQQDEYCITTISISTILFALFVYATTVQGNDSDKFVWTFYYGLLAFIPALFIIHFCFRGKIKIVPRLIYGLSLAMSIWSIVFIIMISLDLRNATDENMREELMFEISGASIGLATALYHVILTWRMFNWNTSMWIVQCVDFIHVCPNPDMQGYMTIIFGNDWVANWLMISCLPLTVLTLICFYIYNVFS